MGGTETSNLGRGVISETSSDGETHVRTVNKAGWCLDCVNDMESTPQALEFLELSVLRKAKSRILKMETSTLRKKPHPELEIPTNEKGFPDVFQNCENRTGRKK